MCKYNFHIQNERNLRGVDTYPWGTSHKTVAPSWHHDLFIFQHLQPAKLLSTTCSTQARHSYIPFFLFLFILNTKIKVAVAPPVMEVEYVNTNEQYYEYNMEKYNLPRFW